MEKVVFIDGNSLLNRAYFALPALYTEDNVNVNAVYGFVNLLLKVLKDSKPSKIVVAFDLRGKNFRKELYSDYKSNRKGMPDDLFAQMPIIHEVLQKMKVKVVERAGIEADDIIGTLAKRFGQETYVVTGDKDLLQLVDEKISVMLTKKGLSEVETVTPENICNLYNLKANQIVDYKALRGDTSDNIPGVKGIGEKTATQLLNQFTSLDGIYDNIDQIKGAVKQKLIEDKQMAYLSQKLATICLDVDVDCNLQECTLPVFDESVKALFKKLQFKSIIQRLDFSKSEIEEVFEQSPFEIDDATTVQISTLLQLEQIVDSCKNAKMLAFVLSDKVCFSIDGKTEYVLCLAVDMFSDLQVENVMQTLKPLLQGDSVKIVYDAKTLRHHLCEWNIELKNVKYDVCLMEYLLQNNYAKDLNSLMDYYNCKAFASSLFCLSSRLESDLNSKQMTDLYFNVELPLSELLFEMEREGVCVDESYLNVLSKTFNEQLEEISQRIFELANETFNIASTKQLGHILFEKLGLKAQKKTKSGYSTDSDVLKKLMHSHDIIPLIVKFRELSKLNSTYVQGIRPLIKHGKVHTTYNQTLTNTGRLSSSDPNLQNIPIRHDLGKEIRKLFKSKNGVFVGADYSQIELRLVAAFSCDENLLSAFKNNEDVHTKVASEIMGIPLKMVNADMRRTAKAVNFGIIYGISAFGLSENTGLTVGNAQRFMDSYFERFSKVRDYLNGLVTFAKANGYAKTFSNRIRKIPELSASNKNVVSFGERVAKNMPLQGGAADVMKIAMLKVDRELKKRNLKSKIVMQIHDELLVDTFIDEVETVKEIVKTQMINAVNLECPLDVQLEQGETLFDV